MRIVFFGTTEFGIAALRALHSSVGVKAAVTTEEKPKGRGLTLQPSPIKTTALALGIPVLTPATPNAPEFIAQLAALKPDLVVLAAYRFILKPELLAVPARGCLNLHPSLLPRYRGAAPIQRAIMNGENETGVSVFLMNERIDQGDLLLQEPVAIGPDETFGELAARLAELSARLLQQALPLVERGESPRLAQDPAAGSYANKLTKEERIIDWTRPAPDLHNLVRALAPAPGACTRFRERQLTILATRPESNAAGEPGTLQVEDRRLYCGTGLGRLLLLTVKPEGGKPMTGTDLVNGRRITTGEKLMS